ncbi:MAG: Crp/Fnr family transcriptional regulator [Acidobacteria bacterium]|nr:Crp/Fnr family transcriptional regulator [Acidobacteriota bacterium]
MVSVKEAVRLSDSSHSRVHAGNRLLDALPPEEYERLSPFMSRTRLFFSQVIQSPGEPPHQVYFPINSVVSLICLDESGAEVEAGVVGDEGAVSVCVFLGGDSMPWRAVVQTAGDAITVRSDALRLEFNRCGALHDGLLRYTQALLAQTSQAVLCGIRHGIQARLARWLLAMHDRARSDELELTHEFLAVMLGVRRAGVTEAAGALKEMGLIDYRRGHLNILDRDGLEGASCECYRLVRGETERVLGAPYG